jgi:hypothetical protein
LCLSQARPFTYLGSVLQNCQFNWEKNWSQIEVLLFIAKKIGVASLDMKRLGKFLPREVKGMRDLFRNELVNL